MSSQTVRFLKRDEVRRIAGNIVDSTLYAWMSKGIFPKPVRIGPARVAWNSAVIEEWVEDPQGWAEKHNNCGDSE